MRGEEAAATCVTTSSFHAWALYLPDYVLMSSRGPPCKPTFAAGRTLHSRCQPDLADQGGKPLFPICDRFHAAIRAGVVEPDGIEPTTSCLQSTRSTN